MASKIPIYKKSSLPIASKDYRSVVQDVRKRQSAIQVKLRDTQNLKTQLGKLAADIEATKDQDRSKTWINSTNTSPLLILTSYNSLSCNLESITTTFFDSDIFRKALNSTNSNPILIAASREQFAWTETFRPSSSQLAWKPRAFNGSNAGRFDIFSIIFFSLSAFALVFW